MVEKKLKQTDVGLIPEDWEVVPFSELFIFLSTASYSRSELDNNSYIGYIHYGDIHTRIGHHLDTDKFVSGYVSDDKLKSYSYLKQGDLIVADASEDYAGVGKGFEVINNPNRPVISGLHTFLIREKRERLALGFKGYFHCNPIIKKQYDTLATGLKVFSLSKSVFDKIHIPVPTFPEQQAIAETLTHTDEWIDSLEKMIAKKRLIKHGAMQKLLTPKKDWKVKKLGEVGTFYSTNSLSRDKLSYQDGDIYNIHYGDIHTRFQAHFNIDREIVPLIRPEIKLSVPMFCQAGDLVIADASENEGDIGKAIEVKFIGNKKVTAGLHTLHFRPAHGVFAKDFLGHLWQSHHIKAKIVREAQGTKVLGISANRLYDINLSFPSSLTEQLEIATILSDMDSEIGALEQKLAKAKQIKQGMMQELLTGRIRLIAPKKIEKSTTKKITATA